MSAAIHLPALDAIHWLLLALIALLAVACVVQHWAITSIDRDAMRTANAGQLRDQVQALQQQVPSAPRRASQPTPTLTPITGKHAATPSPTVPARRGADLRLIKR